MGLSKYLMAAAAATMAAAPAVAAPASTPARVESRVDGEQLKGSSVIVALLALAAIIAGIILIARNNDSSPASP